MQRVKTASAVSSKPAYVDGGTPGYFTAGDAVAGIPATVPGAQWFNQLQEEILAVIVAAGMTPSPTSDTQLRSAILTLIEAYAPAPGAATEALAGILKLATNAQALAGTDDSAAMTALKVAAAISGVVRAYTRQQYNAPVARTGQSGSQDIDCDLHQFLSIIATGSLAFAAPTNLSAGKTVTLKLYSASTVSFTWDAAYMASSAFPLPTGNTAGKWMLVSFFCHKAGYLLCTGWSEEA